MADDGGFGAENAAQEFGEQLQVGNGGREGVWYRVVIGGVCMQTTVLVK